MIKINTKKPGIASIPVIMGLTILMIAVGLFIASISLSDSLSTTNLGTSNQALNFAQAGAKDALQKIARNKDYYTTTTSTIETISGGCATTTYLGCASVTVSASSSPKVIISEGRIGDIRRSIQVNLNVDDDGLFTSYTWQE
jgi:hypothetical protein